ncbi:MAG: D-glycerate dehydrogenase [Dehalococcoidia bacterium]
MKPTVFVAMGLGERYVEAMRERCDVEVYGGRTPISREELMGALRQADGVVGSAQLPYPREVLEAAPRLRVISNVGVGFDNVDLACATERGIVVTNTPGVLSDAVAELVFGLMVVMARRLRESEQAVRGGRWDATLRIPLGSDLAGKTLSIIGLGRIGREVAARAAAFKMRVVCYDARPELEPEAGVERLATLDEAMAAGDFVSLHVDLNPSTRHLIDEAALSHMRKGAFLINAARGPVVDQKALAAALSEQRIAGAALDVLEVEPPDAADPLLQLPNVYIVPHIGSATVETRAAMQELATGNLLACLAGEPCARIVNPEALSATQSTEGGP